MEIKRIDAEEFHQLKEEWNDLLSRSPSDNVFLRWEWIHTWWEIFQGRRTLLILTVRQDGRLVGIAPFYVESAFFPKPRTLRFCSDELSPDYMDVIVESGQEPLMRQEILRHLKAHSGEWDRILFENLREDSLIAANPEEFGGFHHVSEVSFNCPYLKIQGAFDDYMRSREKLEKFELEKKQSRLQRENKVSHFIAQDPNSLARSMDGLFFLHNMRAKAKGIRSEFLSDPVKSFHGKLSRLFLEAGILNIQSFFDGETPVAANYAFNYKKKVYFFQSGINPAYRKWSVGVLLLKQMIKQSFDEGFDEFDFLKGDESYKYLWTQTVQHDLRLEVFARTWRGGLFYLLNRIAALLRSVIRRLQKKSLPSPK